MKLAHALKRVGASIAHEVINKDRSSATYLLRVDLDHGDKWAEAMSGFLVAAEGRKEMFKIDVSKKFYVQERVVRYLWRVVIHGNVDEALALFGQSAISAAALFVRELDSFPLVGRVEYQLDPAKGKLKGAHGVSNGGAPAALAIAIASVPGA